MMLKGNFRMTEIPYRGSAPAINDLLAGNIDIVPDYLLANKQNIDAGKLKMLATGRERLKDYPAVATLAETLPGVYADTWMGIAASAGNLERADEKNCGRDRAGIRDARSAGRITALEANPLGSTPDAMRELIKESMRQWGPVVEAAKIVVE
jgi:tripartite-type tricarboxylate transporter receptor subunit TctC